MARKKEAKVEVVNEVAISKTLVLVTYSDGTSEIRFKLTSDELEKLVAAVSRVVSLNNMEVSFS